MTRVEDTSLLATHLWDVRASLESQLRCLTTIQRTLTEFRKTTDADERRRLRAKILGDFADIEGLSAVVLRTLKPTLEEAHRELDAA